MSHPTLSKPQSKPQSAVESHVPCDASLPCSLALGRMQRSWVVVRILTKQPLIRSMGLDCHIWSACTHLELHRGLLFSQTSKLRDPAKERCVFNTPIHPEIGCKFEAVGICSSSPTKPFYFNARSEIALIFFKNSDLCWMGWVRDGEKAGRHSFTTQGSVIFNKVRYFSDPLCLTLQLLQAPDMHTSALVKDSSKQ